jgi:hypothetical protein
LQNFLARLGPESKIDIQIFYTILSSGKLIINLKALYGKNVLVYEMDTPSYIDSAKNCHSTTLRYLVLTFREKWYYLSWITSELSLHYYISS